MEKVQPESQGSEKEAHSLESSLGSSQATQGASSTPPPFQLTATSVGLDNNVEVQRGAVSPDVVQRVQVPVGYDGQANQMAFAGPGDSLHTEGVMNCIAVVAYDTNGGGAVMRHFDTIHAFGGQQPDAVSGRNSLVFNVAALTGVRNAVRASLLQNVAQANVAYRVSLGQVWYDVDQESANWASRQSLIQGLIQVFGSEPERAGSTATYDVDSDTLGA